MSYHVSELNTYLSDMDTSSHIPSKRPRLEANNEETERGITRCEELWYTDGSIVIEAEDTQFRVYKGILSSQSETFRDMFSIPQPPSAQHELVEGCPVVKVGDTAKDWKYVFLELFEKRYIHSYNDLCGLITISTVIYPLDQHRWPSTL